MSKKSELKGLKVAGSIIVLFVLVWYHALFQIDLRKATWFDIVGTFCCLEFLYTGLFITSHDAMHGTVSTRYHRLNNVIGYICFSAYAWFDFRFMHEQHWRHHKNTGVPNEDPDFHNGRSIGFFSWYLNFMLKYMSVRQIIKLIIWVEILKSVLSVPIENMVVYMLLCGLCSSVRLFYFGTYVPHKPTVINGKFEQTMPWEKSKSANVNRWISFLCCYHFDYHWEHHRWPAVPWWELWEYKEMRMKSVS
ncbi:unnamed protein product [Adineta ricciae]|uniref:Fatty acid desaturase domain-containing protein n=1 Tax=Adineta ricciae TaxID=249248 RepID=A0A814GJZ8_ADIRI|nr:unnamed protein product [Adineta ricciae]CAF1228715.1 unnamed protein product [Adineta ricciae]